VSFPLPPFSVAFIGTGYLLSCWFGLLSDDSLPPSLHQLCFLRAFSVVSAQQPQNGSCSLLPDFPICDHSIRCNLYTTQLPTILFHWFHLFLFSSPNSCSTPPPRRRRREESPGFGNGLSLINGIPSKPDASTFYFPGPPFRLLFRPPQTVAQTSPILNQSPISRPQIPRYNFPIIHIYRLKLQHTLSS